MKRKKIKIIALLLLIGMTIMYSRNLRSITGNKNTTIYLVEVEDEVVWRILSIEDILL